MLIAFEIRILRAAARRIVRERSRCIAWTVVVILACVASVVDAATAHDAQRELGTVRIAPPLAASAVVAILVLAALTGHRTARPYGLRGGDPLWWRYAGLARPGAERWTVILSITYTTLAFGGSALALGAAFALAAPEHTIAIAEFAVAATCLAALSRAVALACTRDAGADRTAIRSDAARLRRGAARRLKGPVPRGLPAARWLVAVRRGEPLVPLANLAWGAGAGAIAALAAARLNGQLVSLAAVIVPLAYTLGGAVRRSEGSDTLRTAWWRTAFGTQPRAAISWAIAGSLPIILFLAGGAVGMGWGLGAFGAGLVVIPTCLLVPPVHRLVCLAVDAGFPAALDRSGPGTAARVVAVGALTVAIVTLAWSCAPAGIVLVAGSADLALILAGLAAARITTHRLPS